MILFMALHFLQAHQHIANTHGSASSSSRFVATGVGGARAGGGGKREIRAAGVPPRIADADAARAAELALSSGPDDGAGDGGNGRSWSPLRRLQHRRRVTAHLFCSDEWLWGAAARWDEVMGLGLLAAASRGGLEDLDAVFNISAAIQSAQSEQRGGGETATALLLAGAYPGLLLALQCRQVQASFASFPASQKRPGPAGLKVRTRSYKTGKLNYASSAFRECVRGVCVRGVACVRSCVACIRACVARVRLPPPSQSPRQ
jgi:hypothetical protein